MSIPFEKMREPFERIYADNTWRYGSGEGSLPVHTKGYIAFLEQFLTQHQVTSVVDLGCGDWQFSRHIRWGLVKYQGFDIVKTVIDANIREFSSETVEFHLYSGNPAELPPADLLIAKDVLQHWSNNNIQTFLRSLNRYRFALITNCVNPRGPTVNEDIQDADGRYLDLRQPPFSLSAEEVYSFTNTQNLVQRLLFCKPRWLKRTILVQNPEPLNE